MEFTLTFIRLIVLDFYFIAPLVLFLCLFIIVLGQMVGRIEGWSKYDAVYWSFITALTVGYGDLRPLKRRSKALSIAITLAGIMFSGIFVAITVHSVTETFDTHVDKQVIQKMKDKVIK
jgi:voltage-gated potassium channel